MNLPAWNLDSEYPSITSQEFQSDENRCWVLHKVMQSLLGQLNLQEPSSALTKVSVQSLQELLLLEREARVLTLNLLEYLHCLKTVDAKDEIATSKFSQIMSLRSSLEQVFKPVQLFLTKCSQENLAKIMLHPELQSSQFLWEEQRKLEKTLLSEKEEVVIEALSSPGFHSWSQLYSALSGTMKVKFEFGGKVTEIGLSEANGRIRSSNEAERKAAWKGIQQSWTENQESAAAILNALAGWRLELTRKRSHTVPVDFLTGPLFKNRIQKETLDAMMTAVANNKSEIQEANLLMARLHGKKQLDPWDQLAPAPLPELASQKDYSQALKMVRNAFESVHPEFGEFVDVMVQNKWLEARVLPNKASGAYCNTFPKSRTPRVFQTYLGSNNDISTLAHELGHAFHAWVVRDLSVDETSYPMTLAETASLFAETVLTEQMQSNTQDNREKLDLVWGEVNHAVALLLNIPARFEFESQFYEKRSQRTLSARELSDLTDQAWTKWYGDTLSENEKMFWATKLHFSISEVSFYNFPYTFGYLFALSIFSRKEELGENFWPLYKAILRDTGRMTAEELIQKHLGEDIRDPQFWQKAIDVVKGKIGTFKSLIDDQGFKKNGVPAAKVSTVSPVGI